MSPLGPSTASKGEPAESGRTPRHRVLVVGPARSTVWKSGGTDTLFVHTRFVHLSRHLLDTVRPDSILAPLIAAEWDVLDLAEVLHGHNYSGPLLIQSRPLPHTDLVQREIIALFPGISLAFVDQAE